VPVWERRWWCGESHAAAAKSRKDIERRVRELLVELRVLPAPETRDEDEASLSPGSGEE
jgi:hypothetical protein